MDNAGENQGIDLLLKISGLEAKIEYSTPYKPEQNGKVERIFSTLWGRTRSMLNGAGIEPELREALWAECGDTVTILSNLMAKRGNKSPHERYFGYKSPFGKHLRTFGEMGVKLDNSINLGEKLRNKGKMGFFVVFAKDHTLNSVMMYDIQTNKVVMIRKKQITNAELSCQ